MSHSQTTPPERRVAAAIKTHGCHVRDRVHVAWDPTRQRVDIPRHSRPSCGYSSSVLLT